MDALTCLTLVLGLEMAWLQGGGCREDSEGCSMVEETPMEHSHRLVVFEHYPKVFVLKAWSSVR